jgi:hypothetical protein
MKQDISGPAERLSFFRADSTHWNSIVNLIFENLNLCYIRLRSNPTSTKRRRFKPLRKLLYLTANDVLAFKILISSGTH